MIFVVFGGLIVAIVLALIVLAFLGIPLAPYNIGKTRAASERGFDELLVPDYLIAPGITINEDGAFTTGWRLLGPDAVSNSEGAIRRLVGDFNAALSCTREGWMYEFQRVRLPVAIDDNEAFLPTATQRVLREQRVLECWTDEVRLLVTYLPPDDIALGAVRLLVHEPEDVTAGQRNALTDGLRALEEGCRMIETILRSCMVDVQRFRISGAQDDLVNTLYRNVNGWELPGVTLPSLDVDERGLLVTPIPVRELLAVQDFEGGMALRYGKEHVRVISIVAFPPRRRAKLTAELAQLAIPMRDHTRLIVGHPDAVAKELAMRAADAQDDSTPIGFLANPKESKSAADLEIAKRRLDKDGLMRLSELQEVVAEHKSGARKHSWYSRIVELRSENVAELDRWERAVVETLRVAGFGVRVEDLHAVDAWLSTLGGNGYNFVRRTLAHGVTVGDLANLTDAWRGRETIYCDKCPKGTKPIAWARRADTLAPFALDLHAGRGDVMSSIVVGPIRFGKTTLVDFIIGGFRKADSHRVIGLDYLRSEERTAVMLGGAYGAPGEADSAVRLCPFSAIDTVTGRTRAVEWCSLVLEQNGVKDGSLEKITEAIDLLRDSPTWYREACMTLFVQKLTAPRNVKSVFAAYAEGGPFGHIFDATPHEMLSWARPIRVYDTTALHKLSDLAMYPALMLLCADVEREIDGRRTLLVIEEAHMALKHKVLAPWLVELLRTNRKKHLGIIFVLTDLEGIPGDILRNLKSLCGTVFATENPNARATVEAYKLLGFEGRMLEALIPSRNKTVRRDGLTPLRYTYWQLGEDGIAPFVLDLSPAELEVYARGSDADKALTRKALLTAADTAPAEVFQSVGQHETDARWRMHHEHIREEQEHDLTMVAEAASCF